MNTHTIQLHRVLLCPPERAYRAFVEPAAMVKWLPPHGFTGTVHEIDAFVGGGYHMSFTNFSTGHAHSFRACFKEMRPGERLVYTDVFDDPNLPGEMVVTIVFAAVSVGTELRITQEGVPAMIPAECCYLGWQESLQMLAHLVEAEIPDEG